jgi:hypothetical protein
MQYEIKFDVFRSSLKSWEKLCAEAAAFATEKGPDRIINISMSEDHSKGVVVVWYRGEVGA